MCLDTVDKEIRKTTGKGYKFFYRRGGKLRSPIGLKIDYKVNEWVTDEKRGC